MGQQTVSHMIALDTWLCVTRTFSHFAAAHSLQCYTCQTVLSNAKCLKTTKCTKDETYCRTSVHSATIGTFVISLISKECAQSCTPANSSFAFISNHVTCCTTDLCN
ncbi:hypothetical protein GDO78_016819 [Eleutherodactylus coqui]|uniref:UPAR/Ly6 domain-containing protein n=1 Tax=Eleutherodactylus coqui TaxID=57060 RepID=A0A8J6EBD4_ELECQ|nr:hypothetical protein GDO78_016819 [Eleutherodactylus coqui]